jgi:putative tricarboxylic transport membrane protein
MDFIANLELGFWVALTPENLGLCLLGCMIGTFVGVLPGIGPGATIAMLLPVTFGLPATGAMVMLAGIYYGAQYGGSTTAILVKIPGEATSLVTVFDGNAMAKLGKAGAALGIAAIASFIAGTITTLFIALLAAPLSVFALRFGPVETFALLVLGLSCVVALSQGPLLKAAIMAVLGLLLSTIGTDPILPLQRLTFGWSEIADGLNFVVVAMGLFGLAEIANSLASREALTQDHKQIGRLLPNGAEFRQSLPPILRGTFLGSVLGFLPGNGAVLAPFASYAVERSMAHDSARFGKGAIEGVAGPEAANNAAAQAAFVPLLTLGIPPNAIMALMMGAMILHGIVPGPRVLTEQPELFWGMVASMWIGNLMLLVINLPLAGLWVRLLSVDYKMLYPAIVLFCCAGVYTLGSSAADVGQMAIFGLLGTLLMANGFEPAPLLLGLVLGRPLEEKLRQSLELSRGSASTFVDSSIALVLLLLSAAIIGASVLKSMRKVTSPPPARV